MESSGASDVMLRLFAVALLVFANGFFVSAEFALVTVRKTRIDQLVADGHRLARIVNRSLGQPDRYLAAAQLGITMASLGLGWIGEPALADLIEPAFASLPDGLRWVSAHSVAVGIAFTAITSLHIVLGEQVPKIVALQYAEPVAFYTTKVTELFMRMFWPFIAALNWSTNRLLTVIGLKHFSGHSTVHSPEELMLMVTASQEAGLLAEQEEHMLHRVFSFADLTAAQLMTPRTAVTGIPLGATASQVIDAVSKARVDALPVYQGGLDDIVGVVHVRHLLGPISGGAGEFNLADYTQEIPAVPMNAPAREVLAEMRRAMTHHAVVIDEYGGTAGLVTFEDLMERIVGDAGGESDLKALRMTSLPDGSAFIDGLMLVEDFNRQFGLRVDSELYVTIGGFVMGRLGRRAQPGDRVSVGHRTLRVEAVDGLRVAWVHLSPPDSASKPSR